MDDKRFSWDAFWDFPIVGIMRGFEFDAGVEIAGKSFEYGLTNLEVTLNSPDVFKQIAEIRKQAPQNVNIGAGTVVSVDGMEKAVAAGAQYIVSPIVHDDLIKRCVEMDIPIFPGAFTPTEVVRAWDLGAKVVKLFPLTGAGPVYVKSVRAPLNHIPMIAVDGVDIENFKSYLDAGACGAGMGGKLFQPDKMEARDWVWLKNHIGAFRTIWDAHKES